uniref:E3 ubiquitin-protein ligase rififylin-like n=1 Tax=Sinocyclocheilus grahami TaxID=75366 RepID=A0A672L5X7_SINGR
MDCKKSYCSHCFTPQDLQPWLCHTCQRFRGILFERAELMKLKVKDLRDYLHLHEIPTQMCREKEELVDLVLCVSDVSPTSDTHIPPPPVTTQEPNTPIITVSPSTDNGTTESSDSEEVLAPGRRASLSDLRSVEDIEALSVRQLKEILARNFVDYKGCCEKWELMERVTRLYHDQKDLSNNNKLYAGPGTAVEENLCKICMDSPIDCVFLECGHMVTCTKCGKRMNECPICRQYVVRAVHVFRS